MLSQPRQWENGLAFCSHRLHFLCSSAHGQRLRLIPHLGIVIGVAKTVESADTPSAHTTPAPLATGVGVMARSGQITLS